MKYYLSIRATLLIVVMLITAAPCVAETTTPMVLVGRWSMVKSLRLGKLQSLDEVQVEIEFTSSQMHIRAYLQSTEPPKEPMVTYDCEFTTKDGLLMLDLKTAANNPGPQNGIHVRSIYKLDGNTLTICSGHTDDPKTVRARPTEFVSNKETQSDLDVLKRKSPK